MKVLIIEDEPAASKRLAKMLTSIDDSISIIAVIESVEDAVNWFRNNEEPDLAMVDIQLSDGRCFDIFSQVDVECPLVFTTAYDEYAILDPDRFFRINRQMIVAIDAIQSIHQYFNSRLKLNLINDYQDDVLVSRNKVQNFKKWLDR